MVNSKYLSRSSFRTFYTISEETLGVTIKPTNLWETIISTVLWERDEKEEWEQRKEKSKKPGKQFLNKTKNEENYKV